MLEIKVTYFPPVGSYNGHTCIAKRITTELLVNGPADLPGSIAKKLTRILYENCEEFKIEFDDMQTAHASRTSVELSQSNVSNQLSEKINASDAVLFPFYVTYGKGSNLAERYSIVQAENFDKAYKEVIRVCSDRFCRIYTADEFEGQAEDYALKLVALQPQVRV